MIDNPQSVNQIRIYENHSLNTTSCWRRATLSKASLWCGRKNVRMYVIIGTSKPIVPISARFRDRKKQAKCFSLLDDQVLMTHRFANLCNSASLGRRREHMLAVRIATWILNAFEYCDQRGTFHRGVAFTAQSIEN